MDNRYRLSIALIVAVSVFVPVHFFNFHGSVPNFRQVSGGGELFDVKTASSQDDLYTRVAGYGEEGRRNYAFRNKTVDVALPFSLLPFLVLLMLRGLKPFPFNRPTRLALVAVPFLYVLFDLAENGSVLLILEQYPDRASAFETILPYLTLIKRTAVVAALLVPLGLMGYSRHKQAARKR